IIDQCISCNNLREQYLTKSQTLGHQLELRRSLRPRRYDRVRSLDRLLRRRGGDGRRLRSLDRDLEDRLGDEEEEEEEEEKDLLLLLLDDPDLERLRDLFRRRILER